MFLSESNFKKNATKSTEETSGGDGTNELDMELI
jgi:hypothetical protein